VSAVSELARLGTATVYEAAGREGLVDLDLHRIVPGSRAAGPARPVLCGQGDNLMVHAAIAHARPGDVLVLTMPDPAPVALVGDLLATQALRQGVAALLVDGSVRDVEKLVELGLPVWARWIRVRGAVKHTPGTLDEPVTVGGQRIAAGDIVVLDADGIAVVQQARIEAVLEASLEREEREWIKREQLRGGALSYDLDNLRERVESR
jgi:4-hydroxy-4-methyl-2-oxoglutarate aldolase